jgi:hypothetical protein
MNEYCKLEVGICGRRGKIPTTPGKRRDRGDREIGSRTCGRSRDIKSEVGKPNPLKLRELLVFI